MRLAIPVTCFFCDRPPLRGRVRSSWSKPAIRICEVPALEGSVEGAGLECGRISPRIDSSPFVWIPVEGVLRECECRVWVRQLISWTQNDWEGCWNHSVARSYLPAALRVVSSWSGEACPPTDWSSGRGPPNASYAQQDEWAPAGASGGRAGWYVLIAGQSGGVWGSAPVMRGGRAGANAVSGVLEEASCCSNASLVLHRMNIQAH